MSAQLLTEQELSEWCGYKRQGDIEKFLIKEGIKFFRGKDGKLLTTHGLIDASKLNGASNEIEFLD